MAQKMALWGADAELTSVPVWYARPCFFDGKVGYHLRYGRHFLSREDWAAYIEFLNKRFSKN